MQRTKPETAINTTYLLGCLAFPHALRLTRIRLQPIIYFCLHRGSLSFAELEAEISHVQASAEPVAAYQARPYKKFIKLRYNSANFLFFLFSSRYHREHKR